MPFASCTLLQGPFTTWHSAFKVMKCSCQVNGNGDCKLSQYYRCRKHQFFLPFVHVIHPQTLHWLRLSHGLMVCFVARNVWDGWRTKLTGSRPWLAHVNLKLIAQQQTQVAWCRCWTWHTTVGMQIGRIKTNILEWPVVYFANLSISNVRGTCDAHASGWNRFLWVYTNCWWIWWLFTMILHQIRGNNRPEMYESRMFSNLLSAECQIATYFLLPGASSEESCIVNHLTSLHVVACVHSGLWGLPISSRSSNWLEGRSRRTNVEHASAVVAMTSFQANRKSCSWVNGKVANEEDADLKPRGKCSYTIFCFVVLVQLAYFGKY